ncbi:MAG: hypothetical protein J5I94_03920 [Phaeodactylibacter sp.]|nr:hypothetical protein [Phaeodactylibacter sp.]
MKNPLEWIRERFYAEPDEEELFPPAPNLEHLPEPYLVRFGLHPVQEPAQVIGRDGEDGELKAIEKALSQWKSRHRPLLLAAEQGVGATSLLNAALPLLPQPRFFLEDKERITSREELLRALLPALGVEGAESLDGLAAVAFESPRVVIFESLERLLLRRIGGYDLLRDFLHFINATREKIFWIATINDYSLYFLDRAMNLGENFQTRTVSPLSDSQIRAAIEERNEGFETRFLKSDGFSQRRKRQLAKMDAAARQESLGEHFFEQLLKFAGGNISRAIVFWLAAAQGVMEHKVYLKAPHVPEPQESRLEELLVLEAVFQHTSLSFDEVEEVFHYSSHNGRALLDNLLSRGWLYPRKLRSGVQEYQINYWYLHELKKLLKNKLNRNIP